MSKKKCHNCSVVDSIHVRNEGTSRLIAAYGPKDLNGIQMYYIYCRAGGVVNIWKAGWLGMKYDSHHDARYFGGSFAPNLQAAMLEDGVLSED